MNAGKTLLLGSIAAYLTVGCGPPPQLLPAVPAGVEVKEAAPPQKDSDAPSAIGESKITEKKLAEAKPTQGLETVPALTPEAAAKDGLKIETTAEGKGEGAKAGQTVTVHYTGKLESGTVFDSSVPKGKPFIFTLGQGSVIKGWDFGLVGMKPGEKRKLTIPPKYGYGSQGVSKIPPNSTLIFEIEMLKIN